MTTFLESKSLLLQGSKYLLTFHIDPSKFEILKDRNKLFHMFFILLPVNRSKNDLLQIFQIKFSERYEILRQQVFFDPIYQS